MSAKKKAPMIPSSIKYELCGIIFTTEQDKEQHMKLEHLLAWVRYLHLDSLETLRKALKKEIMMH